MGSVQKPRSMYFGYGSNLSTAQMQQRCSGARPLGLAVLRGWRWIINQRGYANVVQWGGPGRAGVDEAADDGNSNINKVPEVYGLVYSLTPDDETRLDGFEGVPDSYTKEQCWVLWRDGRHGSDEAVRALVYIDWRRTAVGRPRVEYVGRMKRGLADAVTNWGMPLEYAKSVESLL